MQNYRSHSTLLAIPNALFYNQTLVAAADQSKLLPPAWLELLEASHPASAAGHQRGDIETAACSSMVSCLCRAPTLRRSAQQVFRNARWRDCAAPPLQAGSRLHRELQEADVASIDLVEHHPGPQPQAFSEANLPSTLFFGVRGKQASGYPTSHTHSCSLLVRAHTVFGGRR